MNKLIGQILKFGVVGVICFFIDFGLYNLCNFMGMPYLLSGFIGFTVSVVANYLLSMRYVFSRREDMSRAKEFVIFVILSAIGLLLNELILYLEIDVIYPRWGFLQRLFSSGLFTSLSKLGATAIVMVYDFISRKMFLEGKSAKEDL